MEEDQRGNKRWEDSLKEEIHNRIDERMRRRHGPGLSHLILGVGLSHWVSVSCWINMGIYSIGDIWRYWPVILIALGLSKIMDSPVGGGKLWGGFMVLIGGGILADNLHLFHFSFNLIWPLAIIYFGAMMFWRGLAPAGSCGWPNWNPNLAGRDPNADLTTPLFSAAGSGAWNRRNSAAAPWWPFSAATISTCGTRALPAKAPPIDVNALFGGIDIQVPDTWKLEVRASAIFGGVEDKTAPARTTAGCDAAEADHHGIRRLRRYRSEELTASGPRRCIPSSPNTHG